MTTRTPAVLHALESGVLDLYRATVITDATYRLDDQAATRVATHVVNQAEGCKASQVRALVRRAVLHADPEGTQRRQEQARADRRVVLTPLDDGMAELTAFLPAEQAVAVYQKVDDLARSSRLPGDQRGADERRADAFVNLLLGRRAAGVTGQSGLRPLVHVTVAATTLAGADNKPGMLAGSTVRSRPCSPERSQRIPPGCGSDWSPIPSTGHLSNIPVRRTGHRPYSMISSAPATTPAGSPDVSTPHNTAIWTTRSRGPPAPPRSAIWAPCAGITTASNTTRPGG